MINIHGLDGVTDEDALKLQKCIYGLVQVASQYHNMMVEVLKSIGFISGDLDPCLYIKRDEKMADLCSSLRG